MKNSKLTTLLKFMLNQSYKTSLKCQKIIRTQSM